MSFAPRHPPSKHDAVAELMRGTDLRAEAVAEKTGVPYPTVCKWNQRHQWRPSALRTLGTLRPARWSSQKLAAVARLHAEPAVDPGDLAEALGTKRDRADALFSACGLPHRAARAEPEAGSGVLRTALRAHVARQIAAFDALLSRGAGAGAARGGKVDSARVLRDLGGLKKLLDDLDAAAPVREAAWSDLDLPALRADIARRFAALAEPDADWLPDEDAEPTAGDCPRSADAGGSLSGDGDPGSREDDAAPQGERAAAVTRRLLTLL